MPVETERDVVIALVADWVGVPDLTRGSTQRMPTDEAESAQLTTLGQRLGSARKLGASQAARMP